MPGGLLLLCAMRAEVGGDVFPSRLHTLFCNTATDIGRYRLLCVGLVAGVVFGYGSRRIFSLYIRRHTRRMTYSTHRKQVTNAPRKLDSRQTLDTGFK